MELPTIRDLMTTDPVTITSDVGIDVALETMNAKSVRRLPVVSDTGRVIGIITREDVRAVIPRGALYMAANEGEPIQTVRQVMASDLITVRPDELLDRAASLMLHRKVGGLPVVENIHLVGILTESDIFRWVAGEWDQSGQTRWK